MNEYDIAFEISDLSVLKRQYVYLLIKDEVVVYIGICNMGVSFIYSHKNKCFDKVSILNVPSDKTPEEYKDELISRFNPIYNSNAQYVKKPKVDFIWEEDLISLGKVREILLKCDLDIEYPNNSSTFSQYIEYTFVKKNKLHTIKSGNRSYISITDFKNICVEKHNLDITKYLK